MKLSESFFYTLRDVKDEDCTSSKLLVKAGMIKKSSSGIYMFMPLGLKVKNKIENIIREEMNSKNALELDMPALIPGEVYEQAGRRDAFGKDMFSLKDRYDRDYVLGPTHEELFVIAAKSKVKSYKDMPFNLYQFQNKFRDEKRPRYGLIRTREFTMKDAYSFDTDNNTLDVSYNKMYEAYNKMFDRMGINYKVVKSGVGAMGGLLSEEYQAITDIGEDTLVLCDSCDYASNIEIADIVVNKQDKEAKKQMEKISTPNVKTMDDIMEFLKIGENKAVKTLVYNIDGEIYFILVKGNRELNEDKLTTLLSCNSIEMATLEELQTVCSGSFGSLGPINTKAKIIVDNEVLELSNFVVGANEEDFHFINVNLEDFEIYKNGDIVNVVEGDSCPKCGGKLYFKKGIEVGNLFKLGTKYSEALNLKYLDKNNELKPVVMGCYGIGTARCMAAIIEQHNDENGIIWPKEVAPFDIAIISINNDDIANDIYEKLSKNYDVLLDDRNERPGVKFKDIDLIGIPIKITVGKKASDNIIEIKTRDNIINKEININNLEEELKNI